MKHSQQEAQFISMKDVLGLLAQIELCFENDWTCTRAALGSFEQQPTFLSSKEETGSSNLDGLRDLHLRLVEKSGLTRDQIFGLGFNRCPADSEIKEVADDLRY